MSRNDAAREECPPFCWPAVAIAASPASISSAKRKSQSLLALNGLRGKAGSASWWWSEEASDRSSRSSSTSSGVPVSAEGEHRSDGPLLGSSATDSSPFAGPWSDSLLCCTTDTCAPAGRVVASSKGVTLFDPALSLRSCLGLKITTAAITINNNANRSCYTNTGLICIRTIADLLGGNAWTPRA